MDKTQMRLISLYLTLSLLHSYTWCRDPEIVLDLPIITVTNTIDQTLYTLAIVTSTEKPIVITSTTTETVMETKFHPPPTSTITRTAKYTEFYVIPSYIRPDDNLLKEEVQVYNNLIKLGNRMSDQAAV